MRFPLIVFDFDGTLADSFERAVAIFRRIGPSLGLKALDTLDLTAARGQSTKQFFKTVGVTFWNLPRIVRAYHAAAAESADELKIFPGWFPVLDELTQRGHRLGILSSNAEPNIRKTLQANGVEQHFSFVVGYPKLFGKAKAIRKILRVEKVSREQMLYVGDEVRDIEAAQKSSVASAACNWGFQNETILSAAKPHWILAEPAQLTAIVSSASDPIATTETTGA